MPIPQRSNSRPLLVGGCAEQPENMKQLLELGVSRKKGLASYHFREDATYGPDVDPGGVMGGSEEDLGSPVPESHDLVGVALERNGECTAKAKISDLEDAPVLVDKQILGLEITVENAVRVAVGDALAELVKKALDQGGREWPGIGALAVGIDKLLQIGVEVLEDEVKEGFAVFVEGVLDAEEADDIEGLGEHLEERDLSKSGGRDSLLVHLKTGLLQGHHLSALLVFRLIHLPVRSFTYLLQFLVFLH